LKMGALFCLTTHSGSWRQSRVAAQNPTKKQKKEKKKKEDLSEHQFWKVFQYWVRKTNRN